MKRSTLVDWAREAVEAANRGSYLINGGIKVDISNAVRSCLNATRLFNPTELKQLCSDTLANSGIGFATKLEVANETTLAGIARLLAEAGGPIAALNFASAKNPGGGFLRGSQAQEESLARSSALYASLMQAWDFYEKHRALPSKLYSDAMILSPGCPVFRNDEGAWLADPHLVSFITAAAPNACALSQNQSKELASLWDVFRRRSEYVLAVAAAHGYSRLVLGAWGCGVFGNNPELVASVFADHLRGTWSGRFERVLFSVLDTSENQDTFDAFRCALFQGD